jgi:hypothetical protein
VEACRTRTPAGLDLLIRAVEERTSGRTKLVLWG